MLLWSPAWLLALVLAGGPAAGPSSVRFAPAELGCPMHPDVRSEAAGTCPQCGMALVPMGPAGGPAYALRLEASPARPVAGQPVRLRFVVLDPTSSEPVKRFEIVHEMPFHLFVVSDDLVHYDHVHPELREDGSLDLEIVLPRPGAYSLFCDFLPSGGTPQVVRLRLGTEGSAVPATAPPAPLVADRVLAKTVDGIRFDLTIVPSPPAAGRVAMLQFRLTDAATGAPVRDLEPYLGAWGHTLVLSSDSSEYVHSHPVRMVPVGPGREGARGGPEVAFSATIATPGVHRLWSQYSRGGRVTTVTFTFAVTIVQHLARWDGTRWRALGEGGPESALDGPVHALLFSMGALYAGGEFRMAGGAAAPSVARWDGKRWNPMGSGLDGAVRALAAHGEDLVAGGEFPGGIARWDGTRWSPLGSGLDGEVHALVVSRGRLVAAGRFGSAGGREAHSIASWDGRRWSPLGDGLRRGEFDGIVWALAARGRELFAGGEFVTAGGAPAANVARWNGKTWGALGAGVRGGVERVTALALRGDDLVAGGEFTRAGDVDARRLATWDGTAWRALDLETTETVRALSSGPAFYVVGGAFSWPGGGRAVGVARGDGTGWSGLGEGLTAGAFLAPVLVIAPHAGEVYAGGGPFTLR